MRLRNMTLAGITLLVLAFTIGMVSAAENATANETATATATETPNETSTANTTATSTAIAGPADDGSDEGLIGPGNALYGLQIAFDNIDEVFTFNESEKLGKQVSHARKRIAEARAALKRNDTEAADKALAQYGAKMNDVNESMAKLSGNDTGLINAQQMITKHQVILEQLLASHPNSTGLQRAYNNSIRLEEKFKLNIQRKSEQTENIATSIEIKEERKQAKEAIKDNRTEAKTEHNESVDTESNRGQSRRS